LTGNYRKQKTVKFIYSLMIFCWLNECNPHTLGKKQSFSMTASPQFNVFHSNRNKTGENRTKLHNTQEKFHPPQKLVILFYSIK
jgi:hypothetical protein